MTTDAYFFMRRREAPTRFRDLDRVAIREAAVTDDGDAVPPGSEGVVVDVIRDGFAYAVEFSQPFAAVATVTAEGLILVEAAA